MTAWRRQPSDSAVAIDPVLELLKLPTYVALHAVRNAHDGTHHLVDHARLGFDERLEISAAQTKDLGRSRGEECAIARLVIHEGQLADQIPRLKRVQQRTAALAVLDNLDSTLDHHMYERIARSPAKEPHRRQGS